MWYLTMHYWTGDPSEAIASHLDPHLRWLQEQQLAGKMLIAGPTPDREVGLIVFNHMSRTALDELVQTEPFVAAGLRTYEVIPWEVHAMLGVGGFDRSTLDTMVASMPSPEA